MYRTVTSMTLVRASFTATVKTLMILLEAKEGQYSVVTRQFVVRPSRAATPKWISFMRGPRFVDLPFRVLLLLISVAGLMPAAMESSNPQYVAFQVLGAILIVSVCFVPLTAGLMGLVLFVVFGITFPEFVNPFPTVAEAAIALVLSQLRIRSFSLLTLLLFGIVVAHTAVGIWEGDGESLFTMAFEWLLAVILGLVAAAFERRIQSEILMRTAQARSHERNVERMRLELALDTHDTVSHGLAAEAAIIRMLGVETRMEDRSDSRITELALVNVHTQQQLRVLLARLTGDPDGRRTMRAFDVEMLKAAEMIGSATEAGGFDIGIRVEALPSDVPAETLETAQFILKELATNMVKHSSATSSCAISVEQVEKQMEIWIEFEASNPALQAPTRTPRSLSARVERAGGRLSTSHDEGMFAIKVAIPVGNGVAM